MVGWRGMGRLRSGAFLCLLRLDLDHGPYTTGVHSRTRSAQLIWRTGSNFLSPLGRTSSIYRSRGMPLASASPNALARSGQYPLRFAWTKEAPAPAQPAGAFLCGSPGEIRKVRASAGLHLHTRQRDLQR
jgi:hypothetical protein